METKIDSYLGTEGVVMYQQSRTFEYTKRQANSYRVGDTAQIYLFVSHVVKNKLYNSCKSKNIKSSIQ